MITSLGKERANLSAFRTFGRFALVWFCLFPLPLRVWDGLRLMIVALSRLFSYFFLTDFSKTVVQLMQIAFVARLSQDFASLQNCLVTNI